MAIDEREQGRRFVVSFRREDLAEQLVEVLAVRDQLRAILSLQRLGDEDVAGDAGELDPLHLRLEDRDRAVDFLLRQRGDDDARRIQLARGFARHLQTDHSSPAENEDRFLGEAGRLLRKGAHRVTGADGPYARRR